MIWLLAALLSGCSVPSVGPSDLVFQRVEVTVARPELLLAGAEEPSAPAPAPLVVTGDHSRWSLAEENVVFEGNVRATRGDVVLVADSLTLRYAAGKLVDAHAEGHVRVERGARLATAERAVLNGETGRIVLSGHPTVRDGPHRMTGESMSLYLEDDRMECEKCRLEVNGAALQVVSP